MSTVLAGNGLIKKYGPITALAGVDVAVAERESLAVMGPSGSGKSTLLHTLAGIIRPDGGQVLLRGERGEKGVPRPKAGSASTTGARTSSAPCAAGASDSSSSSASCCPNCPPRRTSPSP